MASDIPTTMRAVVQTKYGVSKDTISIKEFDTPKIVKDTQVLVKVHCASLNPVDWKVAEGFMRNVSTLKFPRLFGLDMSGVVAQVGSKVTKLKVGDEVFGGTMEFKTFAEYCVFNETDLCIKPKEMSFEDAATVWVTGITAYEAAVEKCGVTTGKKILILGGSGGVGTFAIQVAKAAGAYVATTSTNTDLVKALGADRCINYKEENWWEVLKGENFDSILDCVGEGWQNCRAVLKPRGGVFCTMVPNSGQMIGKTGELEATYTNILKVVLMQVARTAGWFVGAMPSLVPMLMRGVDNHILEYFADKISSKKMVVVMDPESPFTFDDDGVAKMFEQSMSHRAKGKLVLKII